MMKKTTKFIALLSGAALLASSGFAADGVSTDPVGYVTVDIAGGSVAAPAWSFISLPLQSAVADVDASVGQLTSVTSSVMQNSSAAWDVDVFAGSSPYYVRVTSGTGAGSIFKVTANSSTELTVDNKGVDLTVLGIVTGDSYEVFVGDTLLTAFGDDSNGVAGGSSPSDVDTVYVLSGGAWGAYYYNTTASQWRKGAVPFSQNDLPIAPDSAVVYSRVGSETLSYVFTGRVPVTVLNTSIAPTGFTTVSSYFPTAQALGDLDLELLSWWKSVGVDGVTQETADKVYLFNSGAWATFHYDATAGEWRKGAVPFSQDGTSIEAAEGVLIGRSGESSIQQMQVSLPY